jgi:hypothetical protein
VGVPSRLDDGAKTEDTAGRTALQHVQKKRSAVEDQ